MTPFLQHDGLVVAIPAANVDTDVLVPKQYLKRVERTGLADYLFDSWRYLDRGGAGDDPYASCAGRAPDPGFPLNQPRHAGASILVARANFGCGSSREQAVWALAQWGIRALVAPSFGEIFLNNCFANGVLPIVLEAAAVEDLITRAGVPGFRLTVDLPEQAVSDAVGGRWGFEITPFRKACLMQGADAVVLTQRHDAALARFEERHARRFPWLSTTPADAGFAPPDAQP
ncbi:3-isopropylmalate dehydratase small subunit [Muricoccus pecuniae]|uniref:3-isopropylmalate dehydratase small subunit n=1 Tax=Muricoccus pecuniae TaxID=693023 RepID=A0A840YN99_9PROT|nr:3-isopropylmalate dehydratase small subunit [Roseomonas pecuniae]MBB5696384.1 3-isopropylmalate/(R)-2-methylmalate dehydratase small subunit [Roseomonas pecuniae]